MGSNVILWGQSPSYGVKGHPRGQRSPYGGSKVTLWPLWGPILPYGTYRIQHRSMGSKPNLWGQSPSYGVRGHPMGGQRSPTGSKVTLWGVKGHPMGVKGHPMGSMASKITLWDTMGSNAVLWGQTLFYGVRRPPMGSEVTLWGSKVTLWGQRPSYGGQRSPYGLNRLKGRPMGSYGVKAQPMGSKAFL